MTQTQSPPPTRQRWRKASRPVLIAGGLALAAGGLLAVGPRWVMGVGGSEHPVASIEHEPTYQDPALLAKALGLPVAAAYVTAGLDYQRNASFCGPTTAVDVERSLGRPDDQEHVLDGTGVRTVLGYVWGGLTLDEEAGLIREKTGRTVTVLRDLDLKRFREELVQANHPARRYTVNFARGPLFGRGGGHHSPIGGYLAASDLVLVFDVNPKFRPWLVKADRLFEAVDTVDRKTNRKRGLIRIE